MAQHRGELPDLSDDLTPRNITPELIKELATPVGYIVLNCAMIEQALVAQIEAIGHLGAAAGINMKRQGALKDRIKLIRRLLKDVPELAEYSKASLDLIDRAERLQVLRHVIVHGSLQAFIPDQKAIVFNRLVPTKEKDGHDVSQELVYFESLQRAVNEVAEVRQKMERMANSLSNKFGQL